jgi:hypothetical protein
VVDSKIFFFFMDDSKEMYRKLKLTPDFFQKFWIVPKSELFHPKKQKFIRGTIFHEFLFC